MAKMNKRVKRLWVEALKSGKYQQQGEGRLRQGKWFSPLGVLCELFIQEEKVGYWTYGKFFGCDFILPAIVMEWAELEDSNPELGKECITVWNDGGNKYRLVESKTFEQIANLIQRYL